MRKNLIQARKDKEMTQAQVAEYLGIASTSYQKYEYGSKKGIIENWDMLEDLFGIHQRILRVDTKKD